VVIGSSVPARILHFLRSDGFAFQLLFVTVPYVAAKSTCNAAEATSSEFPQEICDEVELSILRKLCMHAWHESDPSCRQLGRTVFHWWTCISVSSLWTDIRQRLWNAVGHLRSVTVLITTAHPCRDVKATKPGWPPDRNFGTGFVTLTAATMFIKICQQKTGWRLTKSHAVHFYTCMHACIHQICNVGLSLGLNARTLAWRCQPHPWSQMPHVGPGAVSKWLSL